MLQTSTVPASTPWVNESGLVGGASVFGWLLLTGRADVLVEKRDDLVFDPVHRETVACLREDDEALGFPRGLKAIAHHLELVKTYVALGRWEFARDSLKSSLGLPIQFSDHPINKKEVEQLVREIKER